MINKYIAILLTLFSFYVICPSPLDATWFVVSGPHIEEDAIYRAWFTEYRDIRVCSYGLEFSDPSSPVLLILQNDRRNNPWMSLWYEGYLLPDNYIVLRLHGDDYTIKISHDYGCRETGSG